MIYRCFNPRPIVNPYTKKVMYTDCGDCEACYVKRSAELSERIKRECMHNAGNNAYFITLTYDNTNLPAYTRCERTDLDNGYVWRSNAQGYGPIIELDFEPKPKEKEDDEEEENPFSYVYPEEYYTTEAFGHLCYEDVLAFMNNYRGQMHQLFTEARERTFFKRLAKYQEYEEFGCLCTRRERGTGKIICNCPDYVKDPSELRDYIYFHHNFKEQGLTYADVKYRYFLCGEYGSSTMRPHYHLLVWFPRRFTPQQELYVLQRLRSCWKNGIIDIRPVTDDGVAGYLSSYVTSRIGLYGVYKDKSLRPFCTFSKNPVIGSYEVDYKEIRSVLFDEVNVRTHYDSEKCEYVDDILSKSYWRRHFPKCSGFSYSSLDDKLRIYSYVFNYFKALGVTHDVKSVEQLELKDIEFPVVMYSKRQSAIERQEYFCREYEKLFPDDYDHPQREVDFIRGRKASLSKYYAYRENFKNFYEKYVLRGEDVAGLKEFKDYEEWSYLDRYASLVCYKYCVVFGVTPAIIVDAIIRLYSRLELGTLANFYAYQQERIEANNHCDRLVGKDRKE